MCIRDSSCIPLSKSIGVPDMTSPNEGQRARMAEHIAEIDRICAQARIMPVITIAREADILPLADALANGGLRVLEVTLRSEHGLEAIRRLRAERPEPVSYTHLDVYKRQPTSCARRWRACASAWK